MKYLLNVLQSEKMHSGSKAQDDIRAFLKANGILSLYIDGEMERLEKYAFLNSLIKKKIAPLTRNDELIVQYPFYMGRFAKLVFQKRLNRFEGKKVAIIHDIPTLRVHSSKRKIREEIEFLNVFDFLVAHSTQMVNWLVENGYRGKHMVLGPFDYKNDFNFVNNTINSNEKIIVSFAGNLGKSSFLSRLRPQEYQLNLYGINFTESYCNANTKYFGSFPADVLPKEIKGHFGLVWDGESTDESDEYTRYNSPHKASLYLSMGMPIIVWGQSALADFVKKNQCGIVIDNLDSLDDVFQAMNSVKYSILSKSARKVGEKLRTGYYITRALKN